MTGLRIGDADRDRAAADLGEHYSLGRLTAAEHAERLDAVWTARTQDDVDDVFADLPTRRTRSDPASRSRPGWHPLPFLPILLVLVALTALTHLPFVLLALVAGAWLFRRRRHWNRQGHGHWRHPAQV